MALLLLGPAGCGWRHTTRQTLPGEYNLAGPSGECRKAGRNQLLIRSNGTYTQVVTLASGQDHEIVANWKMEGNRVILEEWINPSTPAEQKPMVAVKTLDFDARIPRVLTAADSPCYYTQAK